MTGHLRALVFTGLPVVETPTLPTYPDHKEDARRIVRHGHADVLAWLGERIGPAPGEPTHAFYTPYCVFASPELVARLRVEARNPLVRWPS